MADNSATAAVLVNRHPRIWPPPVARGHRSCRRWVKSRLYAVRGNTFALRRIELSRSCVVSVTALAEGPTIELVSREQSWVGGVQATKLASVSGEHFLVHAPLQYYYWQRREVCASRNRALPRNPSEFSGQASLGHPRLRPSE
jgi:hypothetical protein